MRVRSVEPQLPPLYELHGPIRSMGTVLAVAA